MAKDQKAPILKMPSLKKVTINVGVGPFKENKEILEAIGQDLARICGQKPKITKAKKSISGFKLREGQQVGFQVTMRGQRMWDFTERLISVVFPRIRDFEGIPVKSFDKNMNFTFGFNEQSIFPEIRADEIKQTWGMSVTCSLRNTQNVSLTREYLKAIGFIFKEDGFGTEPKPKQ
jgi:large subunit ribosomal protein L5